MCGRFTLRTPARDMVEIFELLHEPEVTPRFNIAPTSQVAVVRQAGAFYDAVGLGANMVEGSQG
jgi:putative SOS response-associated peptidase YedK